MLIKREMTKPFIFRKLPNVRIRIGKKGEKTLFFSLDKDIEGNPTYINQGDHLHPSDPGKELFSQLVADAVYLVLTNN